MGLKITVEMNCLGQFLMLVALLTQTNAQTPTSVPIPLPTSVPTPAPSVSPLPSSSPTPAPTPAPSVSLLPSSVPIPLPTSVPIPAPTPVPSVSLLPSSSPTRAPSYKYKDYFEELDYCSDPLYWSNYKISAETYDNLDKLQNDSRTDYETFLQQIWYNDEILISRSKLIDCIGFAQRVACHVNIPRSNHLGDRKLCKGMCKQFHTRCTVDNVDYIERGFDSDYEYYDCNDDNTEGHDCSPASMRVSFTSPLVVLLIVILSSFLMM